jgi:hypothetical protein
VITLTMFDSHGDKIEGARIDVETFHNARADDIFRSTFEALQNREYSASLGMRRTGVWEFRYVVTVGADVFTHTETRYVSLGGK